MGPLGIRNRKQMGKVVNVFEKEPSLDLDLDLDL